MNRTIRYLTAALFLALASLAPFYFPWPYALAIGVISAFVIPPAAIITGGLLDVLYYGGSGLPYFTIIGLIIAVIAYAVQQFVKTRIMS
ncbi:MAG: hypothetical protein P4M11_09630 [Candidatus Pacebacteria bacterium]|nr:hypothetical protein [Candidatus Paceibacterota bacterium]